MARSRVEIDPKLRRLLQRLDADIAEPVRREIVQSGHKLFDEAARAIPQDTGALRRSLGLKFGTFSASIGFDPKTFPAQWRTAGWRAHFVHNGTKGAPKRNIPPMQARPFLRNAWERSKREILERQRAVVAAALAKAMER